MFQNTNAPYFLPSLFRLPFALDLSHVPCKFFRQGACQAGNSCPFSHATDVSLDSQPCKYFQKGNCKFGIKCALAHVLPDGRKVNTKNLQGSYQSGHHQHQPQHQHHNHTHHYNQHHQQTQLDGSNTNNHNTNNNSHSHNNKKTTSSDSSPSDIVNTVEPISINDYYSSPQNAYIGNNNTNQQNATNYNNNYYSFGNKSNPNSYYNLATQNYNYNSSILPSTSASSVQISSTAPAASQTSTMATSPFNGISIWSNSPSNQLTNNSNSNSSINNIANLSAQAQAQFVRSISFSNTSNTNMRLSNSTKTNNNIINSIPSNPNSSFNHSLDQSFDSPSQLLFTSPTSSANTQNYSAIVDSAIMDSEDEIDDENDLSNLGRESEDVDFVPSSLNDLLTPQELKRRHSRSSFGSQHPLIAMSSVKDPYSLIEEDTPFIMD